MGAKNSRIYGLKNWRGETSSSSIAVQMGHQNVLQDCVGTICIQYTEIHEFIMHTWGNNLRGVLHGSIWQILLLSWFNSYYRHATGEWIHWDYAGITLISLSQFDWHHHQSTCALWVKLRGWQLGMLQLRKCLHGGRGWSRRSLRCRRKAVAGKLHFPAKGEWKTSHASRLHHSPSRLPPHSTTLIAFRIQHNSHAGTVEKSLRSNLNINER